LPNRDASLDPLIVTLRTPSSVSLNKFRKRVSGGFDLGPFFCGPLDEPLCLLLIVFCFAIWPLPIFVEFVSHIALPIPGLVGD
jgi:hypothetical protein